VVFLTFVGYNLDTSWIVTLINSEKSGSMMTSKKDTRFRSIVETVIDCVLGFIIGIAVNYFVLPFYVTPIQNGEFWGMASISLWYLAVSLIRRYVVRRWFENHKKAFSKFIYDLSHTQKLNFL